MLDVRCCGSCTVKVDYSECNFACLFLCFLALFASKDMHVLLSSSANGKLKKQESFTTQMLAVSLTSVSMYQCFMYSVSTYRAGAYIVQIHANCSD